MPYADLNGAHIHYTDSGGDGDVIVFAHGLLFSGKMYDAQVAHFSPNYRCITFDHRGQGQSGVTKDGYDMDTLAEDAVALIKHLELPPCHLVGLSMGGFVAMRIAARHPELLKSVTLLDTSAGAEPKNNKPKYWLSNLIARIFGLWAVTSSAMKNLFGQTFLNDPARKAEKDKWWHEIAGASKTGVTRAVTGVINRPACFDLLGQITLPVGVGVGAEDIATKPEEAEAIHAAIAGSTLTIFEGSGHSSSIETPELVNDLITQTINR
ncbi:alpha/beta hydrolase [Yoonia sp. BS5-3]|uniref:Alpha/beta fold hydrolase n=1 Tax=Yoonia phaeophyticola TaxID=3137369 RepID=A0ABZ2V1F9_9RHOB